jgi:hypothetical protein
VFGDTTNLADNQIIHYRCDPADKCRVLIGIAPGAYWNYGWTFFIVSLKYSTSSYLNAKEPLLKGQIVLYDSAM